MWGKIRVCERVQTVCHLQYFSLVSLRKKLIISCLSLTKEYKFLIICHYRTQVANKRYDYAFIFSSSLQVPPSLVTISHLKPTEK